MTKDTKFKHTHAFKHASLGLLTRIVVLKEKSSEFGTGA